MRNPVDRLTDGLPNGWRVTIDWLVTIAGAILIVLAIKQWVINPYRIPSSSMEPTLHCAVPASGCQAKGGLFDGSDRVLACRFCYRFWSPRRDDIIVFNTPPKAAQDCGGPGGVFVKRLIGLPGDTWEERAETCRLVTDLGMKLCSGGILGMGETWEQRLELAFELRELGPDEIPLNFRWSTYRGSRGSVAFSTSGGHSAYVGLRGGDYIAVVDGKE